MVDTMRGQSGLALAIVRHKLHFILNGYSHLQPVAGNGGLRLRDNHSGGFVRRTTGTADLGIYI